MEDATREARDELRTSARGWHTVQLAVLGFIGFCGVLARGGGDVNPGWLQLLAGVLVLAALVLACAATALVAGTAWPLGDVEGGGSAGDRLRRDRARLRRGVAMTFVAVALLALATSSSWWPQREIDDDGPPDGGSVQVTTRSGTVCGDLASAAAGSLALDVAGRRATFALDDVVGLRPVEGCS